MDYDSEGHSVVAGGTWKQSIGSSEYSKKEHSDRSWEAKSSFKYQHGDIIGDVTAFNGNVSRDEWDTRTRTFDSKTGWTATAKGGTSSSGSNNLAFNGTHDSNVLPPDSTSSDGTVTKVFANERHLDENYSLEASSNVSSAWTVPEFTWSTAPISAQVKATSGTDKQNVDFSFTANRSVHRSEATFLMTKIGSDSTGWTNVEYRVNEDNESKSSYEESDNLNQNYTYTQPAGKDQAWYGLATHQGKTFKETTHDGTKTKRIITPEGEIIQQDSASHTGSKSLDSFASVTVLFGGSRTAASGSPTGTLNAVMGSAELRIDGKWGDALPRYTEFVDRDGYRNENYREWNPDTSIREWVVIPTANIPEGANADGRTWVDDYLIDPTARLGTGLADGVARVLTFGYDRSTGTFGSSDISSLQARIYGQEIADYNTSGYAYALGHIAGTAAGAYLLAPIMTPLAVGGFAFTAGFVGTTAATVIFTGVTVGMIGHGVSDIASNWGQMNGPQRLNAVGSMIAGIVGGAAGGSQSIRNLPKGFYQKWELNGKLARVRTNRGVRDFIADERGTVPLDGRGLPDVSPSNFRPPASRHTLSRVNQRTVARDLNSVVEPGVDVAGDVRLINHGHATRVGETYVVNGRTYGVHDGTLFPISGPGVHQLNRPAFKALGVFNQFGDTAKARQILEYMARTNPALNQEAIDAALRAWRAGGGA